MPKMVQYLFLLEYSAAFLLYLLRTFSLFLQNFLSLHNFLLYSSSILLSEDFSSLSSYLFRGRKKRMIIIIIIILFSPFSSHSHCFIHKSCDLCVNNILPRMKEPKLTSSVYVLQLLFYFSLHLFRTHLSHFF